MANSMGKHENRLTNSQKIRTIKIMYFSHKKRVSIALLKKTNENFESKLKLGHFTQNIILFVPEKLLGNNLQPLSVLAKDILLGFFVRVK